MIKATYTTNVLVDAGWRSVEITAMLTQVSKGMAEVVEVIAIDGKEPRGYHSRTGATRQQYNAGFLANREVGKRKRLSAVEVLDEVEA